MSNFSFPPPPPAPPKAAPDPSYQNSPNNFGFQRGRGGRDFYRGRGRAEARGNRIGYHPHSSARGGYHQQPPGSKNVGEQGNTWQNPQTSYPRTISQTPHSSIKSQQNGFTQPHLYDSYSNTPNQTKFLPPQAFQNHSTIAGQPAQKSESPGLPVQRSLREGPTQSRNARFPTHERYGSASNTRPKNSVAPAVPGFGAPLPVARSIPNTPLLTSSANLDIAHDASNQHGIKRKRETNQLGLTPKGEEYDESEAELDEEASVVASGRPIQIEYKGRVSVLGNAADVKAWIEERKKRWPTKARMELKAQESAKRQAELEETRRKAYESRAQARLQQEQEQNIRDQQAHRPIRKEAADVVGQMQTGRKESADDRTRRALEKQLAKVEKLRKKLERSEQRKVDQAGQQQNEAEPETGKSEDKSVPKCTNNQDSGTELMNIATSEADLGQGRAAKTGSTMPPPRMDIAVTEPPNSVPYAEDANDVNTDKNDGSSSTSTISTEISSESDSDLSDMESSASAPEEESTKSSGPLRVPPPARGARTKRICKYFQQGRCKAEKNCHFVHELSQGAAKKLSRDRREEATVYKQRKTLHDILVEKEQEQENRLALQAIKYLGEHGFFDEPEAAE